LSRWMAVSSQRSTVILQSTDVQHRLGCIDILSKPSRDTSDGDGSVEVLLEFIEAGCESAELFEVGEGSFDAVALAVKRPVEAALHLAHGARWDDGLDAMLGEMVQDRVGIVALVGEHGLGTTPAKQSDGLGTVVGLAAGQYEVEWQAKLIGEQVDLGRQTSSTPPQSGLRSPFFRAVAAC
jgi:hypothetical protein